VRTAAFAFVVPLLPIPLSAVQQRAGHRTRPGVQIQHDSLGHEPQPGYARSIGQLVTRGTSRRVPPVRALPWEACGECGTERYQLT